MVNLIYILCTLDSELSMSDMMQSLGRRYVPFLTADTSGLIPSMKASLRHL